jgi:hypothetical protein
MKLRFCAQPDQEGGDRIPLGAAAGSWGRLALDPRPDPLRAGAAGRSFRTSWAIGTCRPDRARPRWAVRAARARRKLLCKPEVVSAVWHYVNRTRRQGRAPVFCGKGERGTTALLADDRRLREHVQRIARRVVLCLSPTTPTRRSIQGPGRRWSSEIPTEASYHPSMAFNAWRRASYSSQHSAQIDR